MGLRFYTSFFFWPWLYSVCGILVPQPEIELLPPAEEVQRLNLGTRGSPEV